MLARANIAAWGSAWRSLWGPHGRRQPGTPVRWLCLRAFCYLAASSQRSLSHTQLDTLTQTIELGVYLNRCFDGKRTFTARRYKTLRRGLPDKPLQTYLRELRVCERDRPRDGNWTRIRAYRREVLRISLGVLHNLAGLPTRQVLLPLVCLIQLTDDIIDRKIDARLSLPTLMHPGAPSAPEQARELWQELKGNHEAGDEPLVAVGFLVYLLCRLMALTC